MSSGPCGQRAVAGVVPLSAACHAHAAVLRAKPKVLKALTGARAGWGAREDSGPALVESVPLPTCPLRAFSRWRMGAEGSASADAVSSVAFESRARPRASPVRPELAQARPGAHVGNVDMKSLVPPGWQYRNIFDAQRSIYRLCAMTGAVRAPAPRPRAGRGGGCAFLCAI